MRGRGQALGGAVAAECLAMRYAGALRPPTPLPSHLELCAGATGRARRREQLGQRREQRLCSRQSALARAHRLKHPRRVLHCLHAGSCANQAPALWPAQVGAPRLVPLHHYIARTPAAALLHGPEDPRGRQGAGHGARSAALPHEQRTRTAARAPNREPGRGRTQTTDSSMLSASARAAGARLSAASMAGSAMASRPSRFSASSQGASASSCVSSGVSCGCWTAPQPDRPPPRACRQTARSSLPVVAHAPQCRPARSAWRACAAWRPCRQQRACASCLRVSRHRPRSHQQRPGRLAAGDALERELQLARIDAPWRCVGALARLARALRRADGYCACGCQQGQAATYSCDQDGQLAHHLTLLRHEWPWVASCLVTPVQKHRRYSAGVSLKNVGYPGHLTCCGQLSAHARRRATVQPALAPSA